MATALLDSLKTLDLGFESLLSDSNKNQSDLSVQHGETVATIQPSVHEQVSFNKFLSNKIAIEEERILYIYLLSELHFHYNFYDYDFYDLFE